MDERLRLWCERRMTPNFEEGSEKIWFYEARSENGDISLHVDSDSCWLVNDGNAARLPTPLTPEKVKSLCAALGIRLRDCGPQGNHDPLLLLATHALSAADGIDPTTALALADEVQARFRYPDITPEWLQEIGWMPDGSRDFNHPDPQLHDISILLSREGGYGWWDSDSNRGGPLAHRGDLLKLMELFGHDRKEHPTVGQRIVNRLETFVELNDRERQHAVEEAYRIIRLNSE